ncbi:unnamed protein product [Trichobilharzia regenti]|nr:unnamed protein product [Trichobilharzia regenti]
MSILPFFRNGRSQIIPPLKGTAMLEWTKCMSKNHWNSSLCRSQAAGYLRCRAENNLMDPEEITLSISKKGNKQKKKTV